MVNKLSCVGINIILDYLFVLILNYYEIWEDLSVLHIFYLICFIIFF